MCVCRLFQKTNLKECASSMVRLAKNNLRCGGSLYHSVFICQAFYGRVFLFFILCFSFA